MACKFCNENDPLNLTMSTRIVNGKVKTAEVCFRCYWRERFMAGGEDGMLSEGKTNREAISEKREPSATGMD